MGRALQTPGRLTGHRSGANRQAIARVAALLLASSAALGLTSPAQAQSDIAIPTQVALLEGLSITRIHDMDFGKIAGTAAGTVILRTTPSTTCTASAGLVQSGACQAAEFGGVGLPGQRVRIRRPTSRTIVLTGPGANMIVNNLVFDAGTDLAFVQGNINWERYTISRPDGVFIFRVGGTLNVNANQAPGVYEGTFNIRIDYQ